MTVLILSLLVILAVALVLVAPVLFRLLRPCAVEDITSEWLDQFSPSDYYPMEHLLSDEDFRFLSRQPGFDLSVYRKLRRDRMMIFRQYLRRLICDFNRLHKLARLIVASSATDQSHMVARLFSLKVRFAFSVLQAELSYLLCRIGFQTLLARRTISALEEMSRELRSLGNPLSAGVSA